jgi:hypothetical protein
MSYRPDAPQVAAINGDTCVRSMLELRQRYQRPSIPKRKPKWPFNNTSKSDGFDVRQFDITEDMCIDTYTANTHELDQDVVVPLLYSPLPVDLPTVQKDILILAAALHGDIDRYVRLRRPYMITGELACLVRGIYHFPMFAKWCSLQDDERLNSSRIKKAINARFIMSNDLSRITMDTPYEEIPYCIWFPQVAAPNTYIELARRSRPAWVKFQAARACIVADYQQAYQEINPGYSAALLKEAEVSPNSFYLQDQQAKAVNDPSGGERYIAGWQFYTIKEARKRSSEEVCDRIKFIDIGTGQDWIYDGLQADFGDIEATICASEEARQQKRDEVREFDEQYRAEYGISPYMYHGTVPWAKIQC